MAVIHQSDLSAWIRCPTAFFYQKSGRPRRQLSATAYGSVVHHAMETFERLLHADGCAFTIARDTAIATFEHYWHPGHIAAICEPVDLWLPRQGYTELLEKGREAIRAYADLMKDDDHELLATEYGFQVPILGTWDDDLNEPHVLAGTIDRLAVRHYTGKTYLSVDDYKTGKDYKYLRQNLQFSAYCVDPNTPVLMADLTWKPMHDIRVGDQIQAMDEEPTLQPGGDARRRRWRLANVENVWGTVKEAYRLHMSDGTTLVVGAGHRLLAEREGGLNQWRTVEDMIDNLYNPRRKTPGIKIARVFAPAASFSKVDHESDDYMAGYIAGATLGDGTIRAVGQPFWRIGVAADDSPILDRLRLYLHTFGISVNDRVRLPDGKGWQRLPMAILDTNARQSVEAIDAMAAFPAESDDYAAGWLAGLYDTDGSLSNAKGRDTSFRLGDQVMIFQKDVAVLELAAKRMEQVGFKARIKQKHLEQVGDATARGAFLALIKPALQRKMLRLEGRTMRVSGDVRVLAVTPLGPQHLMDMTTSTGTYVADGIASHNCYATTQPAFWTGWNGEDGFGIERGHQLHQRFMNRARRGTWINLRQTKLQDAGWRGPKDYARFALAVEQIVASMKADIYPLSLSGETCQYCDYRDICAGTGVPAADHGKP